MYRPAAISASTLSGCARTTALSATRLSSCARDAGPWASASAAAKRTITLWNDGETPLVRDRGAGHAIGHGHEQPVGPRSRSFRRQRRILERYAVGPERAIGVPLENRAVVVALERDGAKGA